MIRINAKIDISFLGFIVIAVLIIRCNGNTDSQSKELKKFSLVFKEELVIGNNIDAPQEQLLAMPVQIQTDNTGKIYVADIRLGAIQIYDQEGNYIQTLGRQGRGPEEFGSYPIFDINENNQLVIVDMGNMRISYFTNERELISSHTLPEDGRVWPELIRETADQTIIALYKQRNIDTAVKDNHTSFLLHEFNHSFESRLSSFAHIDSIAENPSQFFNIYFNGINTGNIAFIDDTTVWYAPGIYGGQIFSFQKETQGWNDASTIPGKLYPEQALIVNSDADDAIEIVVYTDEGQETVKGLVNSNSRGLFKLNDGHVIHFSSQTIADSIQTIVEVFDENSELIGTGRLNEFTFPAGPIGSDGYAIWKDAKDRFYFVNNQEESVVRAGTIEGL